MRIKNKKTYLLKKKVIEKDNEGGVYSAYTDGIEIQANIYPASGKLQAEIYGERLNYILNMLFSGPQAINEGDCIVVNGEDYKVISIKNYTQHKLIELEKII